jgi:1,4-dihydroxy-2-naphthoate octaprenyltransferase
MRSTGLALIRAARPLAHANIAPPILFGQALAWATTGHFSWSALVIAQTFGVIDHLVIVFANDYADRDADRLNTAPTPFSGGSRVLPDGELAPRTVRNAAIASAVSLVVFSMLAMPALVPLAIVALALIGAYSYPPLRLSYRGGGELLQGLGVGVVLPLVGAVAQGARIDAHVLVCLVPTFVLGVAGNVLTSIPDESADRAGDKRSPAARLGGERARITAIALHLAGLALGALLLPLAASSAALVLGLGGATQLAALFARGAPATLAFVVLGGACESIALVGWSLALVL